MKRIFTMLLAVALPLLASAQISESDLETDLGARIGATVDKKLAKGLHLQLEGEARFNDNFSNFKRWDLGLGMTYKVNPYFKIGGGYMLINRENSSDVWKIRHRVYLDAMGSVSAGDWRFSLKERLQLTHRDVNAYKHQTTPNSLTLKSRLKAAYKGFGNWEPYGYVELRNVFNDPACTATWNSVSEAFEDYSFTGYTHAYANRLRGSLGVEYKINASHSLDFYLLGDYTRDKEIDTGSSGTVLKSITWERGFMTALCVGYKFSF